MKNSLENMWNRLTNRVEVLLKDSFSRMGKKIDLPGDTEAPAWAYALCEILAQHHDRMASNYSDITALVARVETIETDLNYRTKAILKKNTENISLLFNKLTAKGPPLTEILNRIVELENALDIKKTKPSSPEISISTEIENRKIEYMNKWGHVPDSILLDIVSFYHLKQENKKMCAPVSDLESFNFDMVSNMKIYEYYNNRKKIIKPFSSIDG